MEIVMKIVPDDVARAVFDIATESMDFGSGFLDDEEVEHLRAFAKAIGVDPWEATPDNHKPKYCPGHEWSYPGPTANDHRSWRICTVCRHHEYLS